MKAKTRKVYSREFKLEAMRALEHGKKPATEIARELGIPRAHNVDTHLFLDIHAANLGSNRCVSSLE